MNFLTDIISEKGIVGFIDDYKKDRTFEEIMKQIYEDFDFKGEEDGIKESHRLYYKHLSITDRTDYHGFIAASDKGDALKILLHIAADSYKGFKVLDCYTFVEKDIFQRYQYFLEDIFRMIDLTESEYQMIVKELKNN